MKAIIPTGGRGTRMQPITFSNNKHFIPIANKPLIFYPIETIAAAGITEIAITYNPGWLNIVKTFLGNGSKWGVKFTYILQEKPLGLANIFQVCQDWLAGEPFLLHLGDNIFADGIKDQVDRFLDKQPDGMVTMVEHPENTRMGVPYFDKRGRLIKYVEKPKNPPHKFAIPGLYFFTNTVFKCFTGKDKIKPSARGELEINSPFQWLIDHNYRVDVMEYKGKWLDPGKFDDWIEANQYLLDRNLKHHDFSQHINQNIVIEGRVQIGKNVTLENAHIRGPVSIGDNVVIKDSYIGPFTSIDKGCRIENSSIENSVLMQDVVIRDIDEAIDASLIGTATEITGNHHDPKISFFLGEKTRLNL
ncbi:MAG: glucose-1-phosphate thymidylyltransferase [bacterium]|nr:glucose-1-phosphate thymidylyltransferase [bacterium]